jgi:hypothetical protein
LEQGQEDTHGGTDRLWGYDGASAKLVADVKETARVDKTVSAKLPMQKEQARVGTKSAAQHIHGIGTNYQAQGERQRLMADQIG